MSNSRFKPYPKYRAVACGWIDVVPQSWISTTLGKVTLDKCDGPFGSGLKSEHYSESGVQVVRLQNIKSDGFRAGTPVFIDVDYYNRALSDHDVVAGDVLIAGLGDPNNPVGRACIAPKGIAPAMVKADCFRFRLDQSKVLPDFVAYQLSASSWFDSKTMSNGSTRARIPLNSMSKRFLTYCSMKEQRTIVDFLHYETAKIDALIEKQQQLIALLGEKRQAVINQAATKGVDPDVSLKHSGINWMGKVPAHWKIHPVKRLFDVSYGLMGEIDRSLDQGTKVISLPNVLKNGTLDLRGTSFRVLTQDERKAAALRRGDLLFNWRNGSIDHVGKTALFDEDGDYAHVSFLLKLRALSSEVLPEFYWLALNGLRASGFFGSSKLQVNVTYNQSELRRVPLPVPPIDEQRKIVEVVLQRYKAIDETRERVERSLELLQERRTALISAAVTGKIDVRGWKRPSSDARLETEMEVA